jgi:hypothetical protein
LDTQGISRRKSADEVNDERDDTDYQQKMNQPAGDVEQDPGHQPDAEEENGQDEEKKVSQHS